jgi:hypothetical protein
MGEFQMYMLIVILLSGHPSSMAPVSVYHPDRETCLPDGEGCDEDEDETPMMFRKKGPA